ncbi:hypothetical protein DJ64_33970 [Streptomyces griseorubens]|uniref:Lipoprotein n=1 Tax=Streptomyces griseorubens TaxID=66897 RepID=A0ABR4T3R8_9ACTN|nr:hypothetical protein DJ64_33970 [Streptomyces griseorubens]
MTSVGCSPRSADGTSMNGITPTASATVRACSTSPSSATALKPSGPDDTRAIIRSSTSGTALRANHSPYEAKSSTGIGCA